MIILPEVDADSTIGQKDDIGDGYGSPQCISFPGNVSS